VRLASCGTYSNANTVRSRCNVCEHPTAKKLTFHQPQNIPSFGDKSLQPAIRASNTSRQVTMWSCRSSLNSRPRSCEPQPVAITRETSSVPWPMVWHGHPSQNGNPYGYADKSKLMDWWPFLNLAKNSQCLDSGTSATQTRECLDLVEMFWSKVYVAIPHWRCWNLLKAIIYIENVYCHGLRCINNSTTGGLIIEFTVWIS